MNFLRYAVCHYFGHTYIVDWVEPVNTVIHPPVTPRIKVGLLCRRCGDRFTEIKSPDPQSWASLSTYHEEN